MPHVSRFKRRDSDRSSFTFFEYQLVKDKANKVAADELDAPPPSKRSLGGEGDISGDARSGATYNITNITTTPAEVDNPTVYITAANGITPSFIHPFMRITGSNGAVDITANPQISAGAERNVLSLVCVDSQVTLDHGTGLNMMGSVRFVMTSGAMITFYYSTANNVWNELSRTRGA